MSPCETLGFGSSLRSPNCMCCLAPVLGFLGACSLRSWAMSAALPEIHFTVFLSSHMLYALRSDGCVRWSNLLWGDLGNWTPNHFSPCCPFIQTSAHHRHMVWCVAQLCTSHFPSCCYCLGAWVSDICDTVSWLRGTVLNSHSFEYPMSAGTALGL